MILLIGLGNPGKKFEKTRHNIGSRVIDEFFQKNRDTSNFSDFKLSKKFQAEIAEGKMNNQKIILAKPQTFMNLSGKAVKSLTYNLQLTTYDLFVVHDDIDLPLGKIKIAIGRGAAGHKGVESIIKELRAKNFVRFRIGIRPQQYHRPVYSTEDFVLKNFTKEEEKIVKEVVEKTVEAITTAIKEGIEKGMSKFNK